MKSTLALWMGILMMAGSLFPQTDVEEVFKIPLLVVRYHQDKAQASADFGFWDFLVVHYGADSFQSDRSDSGLPIPLHNHVSLGLIFIMPFLVLERLVRKIIVLVSRPSIYQNTYSYLFFLSLLKPPQLR